MDFLFLFLFFRILVLATLSKKAVLGGYEPGHANGYEVPLSIKGSLKNHPIYPAETGFFSPLLGQACILLRS